MLIHCSHLDLQCVTLIHCNTIYMHNVMHIYTTNMIAIFQHISLIHKHIQYFRNSMCARVHCEHCVALVTILVINSTNIFSTMYKRTHSTLEYSRMYVNMLCASAKYRRCGFFYRLKILLILHILHEEHLQSNFCS